MLKTEPSKFRNSGLFQFIPYQLTRQRCLTRNGVSIRVVDRRASYEQRRALVGYDAVVSDAERRVANKALIRHSHLKLQSANVGMINALRRAIDMKNELTVRYHDYE